ncbi:neuropeptide FF receptor 1-like [Montipora capricornis]|uniref:neuropeptide FF receptor 1-like n=1 Tax=Montipora foliosa TaxID=591990 RepID=UPI0035F1523A
MFDSIDITLATVNCVIAITSIAGNSLVCFVIIKNRDMRTPFNYLLLNLAVADIIYPTFLFAYFVYRHSLINNPDAMPGNAICLSLRRMAWVGADSSVFTLIAIARERYCAVVHPLSIQRKLTWQKLKVIIPGTWILAALLNSRAFVIQSFGREIAVRSCNHFWDDKELQMAYWLFFWAFVGISSPLMIGYYAIVVYTLWFKRDDQEERPFQQQTVLKVRKRVTLMVLTVTTLFEISWISDTVIHLLRDFELYTISDVANPVTHTTIAFNSAVNPFAYALINQRFREKMKGILCNSSCQSEGSIHGC